MGIKVSSRGPRTRYPKSLGVILGDASRFKPGLFSEGVRVPWMAAWITGFVVSERFKESGTNKKRRDYILSFPGVADAKQASKLVGKEVEYRRDGTRIRGRVIDVHGRRGEVRARFRRGLPGDTWKGRVYLKLDGVLAEEFRGPRPSSQTA